MIKSKRRYLQEGVLGIVITGAVLLVAAPVLKHIADSSIIITTMNYISSFILIIYGVLMQTNRLTRI